MSAAGTLSSPLCTTLCPQQFVPAPCQRASFTCKTDSFLWGHGPDTLACKARPSFDRCGTSLSVSLSLSLSCLLLRCTTCVSATLSGRWSVRRTLLRCNFRERRRSQQRQSLTATRQLFQCVCEMFSHFGVEIPPAPHCTCNRREDLWVTLIQQSPCHNGSICCL